MQIARLTQVVGTKRFWGGVAMMTSALLLTGCESMSRTDKGVLAGGGLGAATGALIGSASGNTGAGAAIGTAVGAIAGGLTGNAMDNAEKRGEAKGAAAANAAHVAATPTNPLSVQDVGALAKRGYNDSIIINQIRTTNSGYRLSAQDIMYLKDSGVSDRVITEMQTTQTNSGAVYAPNAPGGVQVGYGSR